jgi:DNA-binding response OmpR family regulator
MNGGDQAGANKMGRPDSRGRDSLENGKGRASETRARQSPDAGPRILLVEDERLLRKPVLMLLREEGFDVVAAEDGPEALDVYRRQPSAIALVILDVHLPGLDGFQVFRRMREVDPDVAVLFVSGNVGEPSRTRLLKAGAAGYLSKPYDIETLVAKIREALASRDTLH